MRQAPCLLVVLIAALPTAASDLAATLGKQHAAAPGVEWEIREAGHPVLGNIRFAYVKRAVETRVGNQTVFSRAYISCQRGKRTFAIELANAVAPADPGGLKPAADPRLVCNRPTADGKVEREEILASWQVNDKIGDALASGLRAFPLRECAAISVRQEVVLPAGWSQETTSIEFDLLPYNREIDAIFATCGELSAYAPAPATPAPKPAVAQVASIQPAPSPPAGPAAVTDGWREARVVPTGKTNVRASPTTQSPIVAELHPGAVVMVQRTATDWWRARPSKGTKFDGYIRQDRLVFR
jgi:hypothetical protein